MAARRFGAYEILYEIKSGGMGAVLLARRRGPGAFEQLVAIKTIRPEHAATPAVRAMFLDEAAILARLSHPGIAHVHDFGEQGGTLYMVMEYVAGISGRELIEPRVPPLVIARAIAEAARGLHAAHEARDIAGNPLGLVHRDISPDNLMLGFDGHVKVIDFGIALVKNRQAPVTEFGTVKGKPPYMSPEQVKNEQMDRRSDVFSLAAVTWELLTGGQLFAGDSLYAVAYAVENAEIRPPSRVLGAALPPGLDAAVLGALERDLDRRTPTAAAFADALEQVAQASGGETLVAWAERELAAQREGHRAWLASVVAGREPLPRAVGRGSGAVTEVARVGPVAPSAPMPLVSAPPPVDDRLDAPARRGLAPAVAVLLLLLLAGAGAVYFATRATPRVATIADAGARDARPAVRDAPRDAAPPADAAPVPIDAPADAAPRAPHDAGRPHHAHDAALHVATVADAAVEPRGTGYLVVLSKPGGSYLQITLDGLPIGNTPILEQNKRPLPAGRHTIVLTEPPGNQVVVQRTFTVSDGQTVTIQPP
ncbi:MAG TPA: serine/threonine-protein kinase [Kofleriaceae bacterium]|nr:serine/threonine-protein kinase [Kofleriaceae bacterium]